MEAAMKRRLGKLLWCGCSSFRQSGVPFISNGTCSRLQGQERVGKLHKRSCSFQGATFAVRMSIQLDHLTN